MQRWTLFLLALFLLFSASLRAVPTADVAATGSVYTLQAEPFAQGRRPDALLSVKSLALLGEDTRYVLTSPLRWNGQDWFDCGAATALVLASSHFDARIRYEAQEEHHVGDNLTKSFQQFGSIYSFLVLGTFEACGIAADSPKAKAVAFDGLVASFISSGIVTPVLKYTVGRVRPNRTESTFQFKPYSGNCSFPSGHTTQAFAVASVITAHYDAWWVKTLAYGTAAAVGYSRIQQNQHFASDVVAGAMIGYTVGRTVVRHNNAAPVTGFQFAPWSERHVVGFQLAKCF
jgi:membrane-associated phospholipid phosphatase